MCARVCECVSEFVYVCVSGCVCVCVSVCGGEEGQTDCEDGVQGSENETASSSTTTSWCAGDRGAVLCAGRVPVVPVHTTAAVCGTAVQRSLGSARPPQWSNNSSVRFKRLLLSPISSCCSRQMQGVVGAALNRRHELRVRCTASALCSSAEAASSVLSTSPESWIARVGRANSSTRHHGCCQALFFSQGSHRFLSQGVTQVSFSLITYH